MLKIQEIREIIKLIDQSDIEEFVFEHENSKLELKKRTAQPLAIQQIQPAAPQIPVQSPIVQPSVETATVTLGNETTAERNENYHEIVAPMVGTFYQSPTPDSPAYVQAGAKVTNDTVVCIVEAMKLFNEIEAEIEGEIVEVLVKDGELVEFGQPLFVVKPN